MSAGQAFALGCIVGPIVLALLGWIAARIFWRSSLLDQPPGGPLNFAEPTPELTQDHQPAALPPSVHWSIE